MINILIMDSDWSDCKQLKRILKKCVPQAEIWAFRSTAGVLELVKERQIDAAFINLEGLHIPGYFLAKKIMEFRKTNIIFTSFENEYVEYAFELRASGYVKKPLQYEGILKELQNLRYPPIERD